MHKNKRIIFAISVCVFLLSLVFGGNASARIVATSEQLYKLSILQGVVDCYEEYAKSSLPFSEFVNYNGNNFNLSIFDITNLWSSKRIAWVTTHVGNSYGNRWSYGEEESHLSCNAIFEGSNFGNGLKQYYSVPSAEASEELKFYGYAKKPNYGSGAVNENSVAKISIASIVDESGNSLEPIKTEGKIECSGFLREGSYEWVIDNCMGSIKASFRGQNIFTITTDGWQYDYSSGYFQVTSGLIQSDSDCSASWSFTLETFMNNLTEAASNLYLTRSDGQAPPKDREYPLADILNESRFKEYLSIIIEGRGDNIGMAQGPLCGMSIYNKPKADIEISAGTNSGDSGEGVSDVYVPFESKRSAGYNFLFNLGVDDDLPHANVDFIAPSGGYAPRFVLRYLWTTRQAKWDYVYALYYKYVQNVIISHPASFDIRIGTCSESKPNVRYAVKVAKDTWCAINISGEFDDWADNAIVSVVNQYATGLTRGTFKDVLEKLSNENFYNKISDNAYADLVPDEDGNVDIGDVVDGAIPPDTTGADADPCYNNAESLGWILCPVLKGVANALDGLYTNAVEPFLVVNPELVATNNGTYDAWKVMITIANAMVLMFLLVVIFSQLTGVGIDNYGIKKALPKIILVAVLVNLSYVICQLAVDISNILGNGLNSLLSNIEVGGLDSISLSDGGTLGSVSGAGNAAWFKTMVLAVGGGLVAIGGVSLVSSIANGGWFAGLVLPILLFFVTALVAVLFFFILLGARKAGVVLLVVIAPLAFVMYMLPNTKKWFDKWLKMFEGLIMLYPLCGLLIGGGELASKILLSVSDDYIMYFTGLIAMVVPFFFIPTLLKGSFAAMGKLGAKISGFGAALGKRGRGRLSDTIKNSDAYKNRVQYNQDRAAIRKAQRTQKRLGRTQERLGSKGKELNTRQQDRLRRAQDTLIADKRRQAENERRSGKDYFTAAVAAEEADVIDKQTSQRLSLMMSAGDSGGIRMEDGSRAAYTLTNVENRMRELRTKAETNNLDSNDRIELAALARGLSNMKGGGGVLGRMVRGATIRGENGAPDRVNSNFMRAFGEVYSRDSIVQKKLNEKDAGASMYTEEFMPGARGVDTTFRSYSSGNRAGDYWNGINKRVKSYAAGLNQGGAAVNEYIGHLSQQDCQNIMNDDTLMNSLDVDVRERFEDYAAGRASRNLDENGRPRYDYSRSHPEWSVTSKTPTAVSMSNSSSPIITEERASADGNEDGILMTGRAQVDEAFRNRNQTPVVGEVRDNRDHRMPVGGATQVNMANGSSRNEHEAPRLTSNAYEVRNETGGGNVLITAPEEVRGAWNNRDRRMPVGGARTNAEVGNAGQRRNVVNSGSRRVNPGGSGNSTRFGRNGKSGYVPE